MKFTKLNENTIKCQISSEELEQRGMHIEDILEDHEKAEEFLQDVLTEARTEMDFNVKGNTLNVQLSVMKDGAVSLVISDDKNAAIRALLNEVKGELKNFLAMLSKGALPNGQDKNVIDIPSNKKLPSDYTKLIDSVKKLSSPKFDEKVSMHIWAEIETVERAISLSKELTGAKDIQSSSFYKYKDKYYFEIDISDVRRNIASTIFILSEYTNFMFSDTGNVRELYEHGTSLIKENAINVLAEMN